MKTLVDECNNTYHHSIGKNPINADYSAFSEKFETNSKSPKFKVGDEVRITKYQNIFSKGFIEYWRKEIYLTDSVLKANPWTYKIKDLNEEKMI